MLRCGKPHKPKRKSASGWRKRASCLHGNKSLDVRDTRDLLTSPGSPQKRLRLLTPGCSTDRTEFSGNPLGVTSLNQHGEDKENLYSKLQSSNWSNRPAKQSDSKNNLCISDSTLVNVTNSARLQESRAGLSAESVSEQSRDSVYDSVECRDESRPALKVSRHGSADSGIHSMTQCSRASAHTKPRSVRRDGKKFWNTDEMPVFEISLPKSPSGFGFTVKGTRPVRVGRVKEGGTAQGQGLRDGDFILVVNGRDTRDMSVHTVASLVRHSANIIHLQVARPAEKTPKISHSPNHTTVSLRSESAACVKESSSNQTTSNVTSGEDDVTAGDSLVNWGTSLSRQALSNIHSKLQWQPELSAIREENTLKDASNYKQWQPDMSCITKADDTQRFVDSDVYNHVTLDTECSEHIYEEISAVGAKRSRSFSWNSVSSSSKSMTSSGKTSCHDTTDAYDTTRDTWTSYSKHGKYHDGNSTVFDTETETTSHSEQSETSTSPVFCPPNTEEELDTTPGEDDNEILNGHRDHGSQESRGSSDLAPGGHEDSAEAMGRQAAVHQLLTSEQDFCRLMKRGIQRFSRPLRYHVMSTAQHQVLFQNLEKLVALSEFHIRGLSSRTFCAEDSYLATPEAAIEDTVGKIYQSKIALVCEAYRMYKDGLGKALDLLHNLTRDKKFLSFIKKLETLRGFELPLAEFLSQPVSHFYQLTGSLDRVLVTTLRDHPDHPHIVRVMAVLQVSLSTSRRHHLAADDTTSTFDYTVYDRTATTAGSTTDYESYTGPSALGSKEGTSGRDLGVSGASSSSSSRNVDLELLDMEKRLSFSKHVRSFPVAVPNRHVIFSGELHCNVDNSQVPLWGILCSDLLLLTQKEGRGRYRVIEAPLFLGQVTEMEFNSKYAEEFRVHFQQTISASVSAATHQRSLSACGVREYRFQTASCEQKWAWKTLLEQRVKTSSSSKSQGDSAFCSMEEFL